MPSRFSIAFILPSLFLVLVTSFAQEKQTPASKSSSFVPTLVEGKFGKALDAAATPVMMDGDVKYRKPPLTVECWAKLTNSRNENILVACDPRESSQHWELRTNRNTGALAAYLPGYSPNTVSGKRNLGDNQWHYLAMTWDGTTVVLYVDGKEEAKADLKPQPGLLPSSGALCIGMAIERNQKLTCQGSIDDVRISRSIRGIRVPMAALPVDPLTIGAWPFDQTDELSGDPAWTPRPAKGTFPSWEKVAEAEWIDRRFIESDTGSTYNGTCQYPTWKGKSLVYKGIALKLGESAEGAMLFERNQLRWACGWTGKFLKQSEKRFGLLNTPEPLGEVRFVTSGVPGWSAPAGSNAKPSVTRPLPAEWGKYLGMRVHGTRTVLEYQVQDAVIADTPWMEKQGNVLAFSRTLRVEPHQSDLKHLLLEAALSGFKVETKDGVQALVARQAQDATAIGVLVSHAGPQLSTEGTSAYLSIPASKEAVTIKLLFWNGPAASLDGYFGLQKSQKIEEELIGKLKTPGTMRYGEPTVTVGEKGREEGPFAVDTLSIPYQNKFKALFFCSGVDEYKPGVIAVSTVHGDVWLVHGVDETLKNLRWQRFASGLYHPLGLKVIDGVVYVLERGQITRLIDSNNDGEAEHYQNVSYDWDTGPGEHSYDSNLETDAQGRFYFFKTGDDRLPTGGTLLRASADGSKVEVYATGFRHPMAMGMSPGGQVVGADQEGNWIPSTRFDFYKQGGFYGFMPAHHRTIAPTSYDQPACWIPRYLDNSAGGDLFVPTGMFGPLSGECIHLSYGRCRMMRFLPQEVNGQMQGGMVDLGVKFLSGSMRGRFGKDGHLYVAGMNGWQTAAVRDGCLHRVRYTGKPYLLPTNLAVTSKGVLLKFDQPLDSEIAKDVKRYGIKCWNYRYSGDYGSKHYSVKSPGVEGEDVLAVTGVELVDSQTVRVQVANLQPVMQLQVSYDLRSKTGEPMQGDVYSTVHNIAKE